MTLLDTHPSGAEDWFCPTCGRRFVVTLKPFARVVLIAGDEAAGHAGSTGGLRIGAVEVEESVSDDKLSAWLDALK